MIYFVETFVSSSNDGRRVLLILGHGPVQLLLLDETNRSADAAKIMEINKIVASLSLLSLFRILFHSQIINVERFVNTGISVGWLSPCTRVINRGLSVLPLKIVYFVVSNCKIHDY